MVVLHFNAMSQVGRHKRITYTYKMKNGTDITRTQENEYTYNVSLRDFVWFRPKLITQAKLRPKVSSTL